MATHSSIFAWKIPWTAEPGRLPSMGSQRESDTIERLHFTPGMVGGGWWVVGTYVVMACPIHPG